MFTVEHICIVYIYTFSQQMKNKNNFMFFHIAPPTPYKKFTEQWFQNLGLYRMVHFVYCYTQPFTEPFSSPNSLFEIFCFSRYLAVCFFVFTTNCSCCFFLRNCSFYGIIIIYGYRDVLRQFLLSVSSITSLHSSQYHSSPFPALMLCQHRYSLHFLNFFND